MLLLLQQQQLLLQQQLPLLLLLLAGRYVAAFFGCCFWYCCCCCCFCCWSPPSVPTCPLAALVDGIAFVGAGGGVGSRRRLPRVLTSRRPAASVARHSEREKGGACILMAAAPGAALPPFRGCVDRVPPSAAPRTASPPAASYPDDAFDLSAAAAAAAAAVGLAAPSGDRVRGQWGLPAGSGGADRRRGG